MKALARQTVEAAAQAAKPTDLPALQEALEKLKSAQAIPMVATEHRMQNDGYAAKREIKLSVQKDHFVAAAPITISSVTFSSRRAN